MRTFYKCLIVPVICCGAGNACSTTSNQHSPSLLVVNTGADYPQPDAALGEALYPDEAQIAQNIAAKIEGMLRQQYRPGTARRDAHPKAHGCVKAEFQILHHLPAQLSQGVFIPGKTYPAWIRFSNGSNDANRADIKGDARGMAIKLMEVAAKPDTNPGGPVSSVHLVPATTQDFILSNHPVFFVKDPARYQSFFNDLSSKNPLRKILLPFALGAKGSLIALQTTRSKIPNPLQTRYWSQVPYQLGTGEQRQAVKYSVKSCSSQVDTMPQHPGPDYLRAALKHSLQQGDACMQFMLQPRTSAAMSVEDSMTEWKESQAPFYTVATIHIPKQVFDTPEQNAFCENLSFDPWHSLPAHKPLGAMNRLRKVIYPHISQLRHQMNAVPQIEPQVAPQQ